MPGMVGEVFVTGASGFVGTTVVNELLNRDFQVRALVHTRQLPARDGLQLVRGDLFDPNAIARQLIGCKAVIHLVGIIRENPANGITFRRMHVESTRTIVDAATRAGVRRFIHMSALGTRAEAVSVYHRTKFEAEAIVRHSGLDFTIFRPSLIHGPGGEFINMEAKWARGQAAPYWFMPYFGKGFWGQKRAGMLQPIHVTDMARAFVEAIERRQTISKIYEVGGADQIDWIELHRIVSKVILGQPRLVLGIPAWIARILTATLPEAMLPFNRDQVVMSQEDNTCDLTAFKADFGWVPRGFKQSVRDDVGRM